MQFQYALKTEILFGSHTVQQLGACCQKHGWRDGLLVADPFFRESGLTDAVVQYAAGAITAVFSDLQSNPSIANVDACVQLVEETHAQFIAALGGGSALDCAKAAAVTAYTGRSVRCFHSGGAAVPAAGLPVIAIPTTAGTGSEVTNVAVLSDPEKGLKAPLASEHMYAKLAIVDPTLTLSAPPSVVASTGLDALSHALEGYWSKNHQPICDACAVYAAKLIFEHLETAFQNGADLEAKENLSLAALLAGLAFGPPKTAACHACSFPLTNLYHIPHGEACAFTLDALVRINCAAERERLHRFAAMVGFSTPDAMADEILRLKKATGMRCTLQQAGIALGSLPELVAQCNHPNLLNNPVEMTPERLTNMFSALQG